MCSECCVCAAGIMTHLCVNVVSIFGRVFVRCWKGGYIGRMWIWKILGFGEKFLVKEFFFLQAGGKRSIGNGALGGENF